MLDLMAAGIAARSDEVTGGCEGGVTVRAQETRAPRATQPSLLRRLCIMFVLEAAECDSFPITSSSSWSIRAATESAAAHDLRCRTGQRTSAVSALRTAADTLLGHLRTDGTIPHVRSFNWQCRSDRRTRFLC